MKTFFTTIGIYLLIKMYNRVKYFIKNIIFNPNLNKDKCIHNIEMSNKIKYKNNVNMIIKRKMSHSLSLNTNSSSNNNNNNNNDNDNIIFGIFVAAWALTISSKISKKK